MEQLGVVERLNIKNNSKLGREGWRHIGGFIHMSKSVKAIDLSGIPFPSGLAHVRSSSSSSTPKSPGTPKPQNDACQFFRDCIARRLGGSCLDELLLSGCELKADQIENIVDAFAACGGKRLSLANNQVNEVAASALARYIESGKCEALDIGHNDLSEISGGLISTISNTSETCPLYALSLENCNLSVSNLKSWLPPLTKLSNFRFLDLSSNRKLFSEKPNAVCLLRRYLPQMPYIKRMHLNDVALEPDHCISIAEILPEIPAFAHIRYLNPRYKIELS